MKTYELTTIADLLQIPADRLGYCLRDIQIGLEFAVLVHGEKAAENLIAPFEWTDDGLQDVTITYLNGDTLKLEVSDERQ